MAAPRSLGGITRKDAAILQAVHKGLEVPEMRAWMARLTGSERAEFIAVVGKVAGAMIDHTWPIAHKDGHTCKSPFC